VLEPTTPVVVYSHVPWHSVFQRPHQIVSRLARTRRVLFIEEPGLTRPAQGGWELESPRTNLIVARPASHDALALELLERQGIERHVAWLYTPRALHAARALRPSLVVYDCMHERTAFPGAAASLQADEQELLRCADVVFTAGPSLYRSQRREHSHVFWAPSSVDAAHFARARTLHDHRDQAHIPHPRLGFLGVLDQRVDLELLAFLADARPDWQIVMIGPRAGIDGALLPRRPNLHYAGARRYDELPSFLAGWDACLLPYARNQTMRSLSPTNTLEYMAAERPIVSTSLPDVAEPYTDIVYLADSPARFVAACERALHADAAERALRAARMRRVLTRTSWDATVSTMLLELERAARRREERSSLRPLRRIAPARAAVRQAS